MKSARRKQLIEALATIFTSELVSVDQKAAIVRKLNKEIERRKKAAKKKLRKAAA